MDGNGKTLPTPGESTSPNVDKGVGGSTSKPPKNILKDAQSRSSSKLQLTSQESMDIVPRFLVVKRKEGDFANVSPFLIDKVLSSVVGAVQSIRKIREGLLIETSSTSQARKLLKMEKFHDIEVSVVPHSSLNFTKGVITCRDLLNCSLIEIVENMADEGVIDVKRITVRREGVLTETPSLILTFNRVTLPKKVKAGIHILPVRPYIPAPLRCFRCQRFGHTSARCDKTELCICGKEPHVGSPCNDPIICINCNGEHSARSRNCPVYKEEAAIQKIKTEEKISFAEARKRVKSSIVTPIPGISYSQMASVTKPVLSEDVVKDIVSKLVPDIVKICLDTIKQTNIPISNTVQETTTQKITGQTDENQSMEINPNTHDKRKRGDNTPSDTECPGLDEELDPDETCSQNSSTTPLRSRKGKLGWKKGRPRKVVKK